MSISIDQNCLNKKNPVEYIVPSPSKGVAKTRKEGWSNAHFCIFIHSIEHQIEKEISAVFSFVIFFQFNMIHRKFSKRKVTATDLILTFTSNFNFAC